MKVSWVRGEWVNLLSDAFRMKTICKSLKLWPLHRKRMKSSQSFTWEREMLKYFPVSAPSDLCKISRFSLQAFKKKKRFEYQMCFPGSLKIYIIKKYQELLYFWTVSNSYMEHKLASNISVIILSFHKPKWKGKIHWLVSCVNPLASWNPWNRNDKISTSYNCFEYWDKIYEPSLDPFSFYTAVKYYVL